MGDINHLQDYTKTTVITDPKIIVTKKAKPTTNNDAGQTVTEVNSFDEVTYTPMMPFNANSDQDMYSKSSPSAMSVNVKRSRHQLHSTPVRGTDHKVFHSRSSIAKTKPSAQDYRLQLGLPPVGENIKKNELHTSISIEDDYSDEPEFESTVIQPATETTGLSDPFGCGQVGLEIPGKRWVQEHLLGNTPSVPTCNQLEVLPPDNTHQTTVKKSGNEVGQNSARIQFRNFHGLDSEYDNLQRAKQKVQHHIQSTTVLKVENKMEQLSSDKTQHHQHSNGAVKTLNKMETLPHNTQHHKQSTTMLKVENEIEHHSSHKTKHQTHPNGVVKTLNKMERLTPVRVFLF
ncbi:hypothetical protein HOLleu_41764 [Holothuria leucospilota]|uniref:Uncharacterized protein n=1 Tax=Holothuria leucospilota TaxID=206669 RepID=A0A9Q1BC13_HOLLE|nr:hypothetical protein HOLleu_41764 [Holothuria leucospilota]